MAKTKTTPTKKAGPKKAALLVTPSRYDKFINSTFAPVITNGPAPGKYFVTLSESSIVSLVDERSCPPDIFATITFPR